MLLFYHRLNVTSGRGRFSGVSALCAPKLLAVLKTSCTQAENTRSSRHFGQTCIIETKFRLRDNKQYTYTKAHDNMPPNSKEAKKFSPTLTRLLKARPAPSRETTLLNAAFGDTKPVKPPPGECCGSSCDPCVMDLYAQELKVWKECTAYRESFAEITDTEGSESTGTGSEGSEGAGTLSCKVPGAFEW